MRVVRVVGKYLGTHPDYKGKLVMHVGLDEQQLPAKGEWMGYIVAAGVTLPFVLEGEGTQLQWGPEHGGLQSTNIGSKRMVTDEMFTLMATDKWPDAIYKITSVQPFDALG